MPLYLSFTLHLTHLPNAPFPKIMSLSTSSNLWSHNLASWNIYISTSLKLLLHGIRNKSIVVIFLCLLPFAKISIYAIFLAVLHVILRLKYYFLVDCFSRTGFQKSFFCFDLNSSFFIYFFVYFFPPLGDLGD